MIFNKTCCENDWEYDWFRDITINELCHPDYYLIEKERKLWEWVMGFKALREYGYMKKDKIALGIGCGYEPIMYVLAKYLKMVIGTDLYGQTSFRNNEASDDILKDPSSKCSFPYDKNSLLIRSMDACSIDFASNSFDILFSFSSLEHFGTTQNILESMKHSYRVLKKGGIYVIALDYIFKYPGQYKERDKRSGQNNEFFTREEVEYLIKESGFHTKEKINYDVDESHITNIYDVYTALSTTGKRTPHIYLKCDDYYFTSLFLALFK